MTGERAQAAGDLVAYDARDYELMVTVTAGTHEVRVEHAAGDYEQANRGMARLAADVIDQLGPAAVNDALRDLRATARLDSQTVVEGALPTPPRGIAVLACRCGRVLNADDLRFADGLIRRRRGSAARIPAVVCATCAEQIAPDLAAPAGRVDRDRVR